MKNTNQPNRRSMITKIVIATAIAGVTFITLKANIISNILMVKKISGSELVSKKVNSTTIPFTEEQGRIVVDVTIQVGKGNPRKEKLILDTGALTEITEEFAQREQVTTEVVWQKTAAFGGEVTENKSYITAEPVLLSIGDMTVSQRHMGIVKIATPDFKCSGAAGLLGSNVLSQFVVSIDFKHQQITLFNKEQFQYTQTAGYEKKISFFPMPFQKNPLLSLTAGGKDFTGILDTGNPGELMLQYKNDIGAKTQALLHDTAKGTCYDTYANLVNINGVVKKKDISYTLQDAPVIVDEDTFTISKTSLLTHQDKDDMNLGLAFLKQYESVVIDWKKNDIYFSRKQQPVAKKNKKEIAIRYLADEKRYVLGVINVASAYYKNGLRAADEVISINGSKLESLNTASECDRATKLADLADNAVSVTVKRGDQLIAIGKQ